MKRLITVLGTMLLCCGGALQAGVMYTTTDDAEIAQGSPNVVDSTGNPMWAGFSNNSGYNAVWVFALPNLASDERIASANFSVYMQGITGTLTYNADLYGLGYRTSASVLPGDLYVGASDSGATLVQNNYLTPSSSGKQNTDDTGDAALVAYLNAQLVASATARAGGSTAYVFVRLNPDAVMTSNYTRYNIYAREYSTNNYYWGKIDYTTEQIPEPASLCLVLAGSGLFWIRRRRKI